MAYQEKQKADPQDKSSIVTSYMLIPHYVRAGPLDLCEE